MQGTHERSALKKRSHLQTLIKIFSIGHFKSDVFPIEIEIDISRGIFRFDIIGLGDKAVEESKPRILSALKNSGFKINKATEKIVVLLSPANKKKEGSHFDLPIAMAFLEKKKLLGGALKNKQAKSLASGPESEFVILGELSLNAQVKSVQRCHEYVFHALKNKFEQIIISKEDEASVSKCTEAYRAVSSRFSIYSADNIRDAIAVLSGERPSKEAFMSHDSNIGSDEETGRMSSDAEPHADRNQSFRESYKIDSVRGQHHAKRALEISLSGNHHLLICGTPGTGKTMIAHSSEDFIVTRSHSDDRDEEAFDSFNEISRNLDAEKSSLGSASRPHHTASYSELIGSRAKQGLIGKLAGGMLIMDEWTEFDRRAIESLRQPLEEGRLFGKDVHFICIATANPCPCGYFNSRKKCSCAKPQTDRYRSRLFGPASQRFDMLVYTSEFSRSNFDADSKKIAAGMTDITGRRIQGSIYAAGKIRKLRLDRIKSSRPSVSGRKEIRKCVAETAHGELSADSKECFHELAAVHKLNPRLSDALILVARTIADIERSETIEKDHLLEAAGFIFKSQ